MARSIQVLSCLAILAAMVLVSSGRADEPPQPAAPLTVVELFTSQGCSSCPPADTLLGELAGRADVLALSQHVDYWDYIGWKDTFGRRAATERQHAYAKRLGGRYVYTPQMVIAGRTETVGSDRRLIERLLAEPRPAAMPPAVSIQRGADNQIRLLFPAKSNAETATVWLVEFDPRREVVIDRGENSGKTLAYYNVVREFRKLGTWHGREQVLTLDPSAIQHEGCAVIVQSGETGPILAAVRISPIR